MAAPVPPPSTDDYVSDYHMQSKNEFKDSFVSKLKSNPFIPLGAALTSLALVAGLAAFQSGNKTRSVLFQRLRVGFQVCCCWDLLVRGLPR
eukprot:m.120565 g.120565  ORF g.120565 m.120565 type:complete len:91 (+) comp52083_c0_seq3:252-524(+)